MAIQKLNNYLPMQKPTDPDARLKEAAGMYEKQFLREMVKAMRQTVPEDGMMQSDQAHKIYQEQLDEQYVEKWGDRGGIGLADMIYKQLLTQYGEKLGIRAHENKPQGPLSLDYKANLQVNQFNQGPNKIAYQIERSTLGAAPLTSPYDGEVLGNFQIAPDQNLISIAHANGIKTKLAYTGLASELKAGDQVKAGQQVGLLGPEAKNFMMNMELEAFKDKGFE